VRNVGGWGGNGRNDGCPDEGIYYQTRKRCDFLVMGKHKWGFFMIETKILENGENPECKKHELSKTHVGYTFVLQEQQLQGRGVGEDA